jgi:hypothetical protein
MTFGESTSGKLSAFGMVPGDGTKVLHRCGGYTYEKGELMGRVGKERGGKEMDIYPYTGKRLVQVHIHSCDVSRVCPLP